MKCTNPEHCWHPTGVGYVQGDQRAGSDECFCCWCGAKKNRKWTMKSEYVAGHGPHHKRSIKVYDYDSYD